MTGIYVAGYENQFFYDPSELTCYTNVQPYTWVEFSRGLILPSSARTRLAKSGRVYLTLRGELYGPKPIGPDDLSLPVNIAFANRAGDRRYGHLNSYRTKLIITDIVDVREVPEGTPSPGPERAITARQPVVVGAAMPSYPSLALNAGITGTVVVSVTVSNGEVTSTTVESGDRLLAAGAVQNIKSWHFEGNTNRTFTATFIYDLERRDMGANPNLKIEMQLPSLIRVTGASRDW
jgi:TonB family protein